METLKEIIPELKYIQTNSDGSSDSCDYLTLQNLYNIAEPKLVELCSKYDITKFELPKNSGYNSLVIYADGKNRKFAIKIYVCHKKNLGMIDTINRHVSEDMISPKIYFDENVYYNSLRYVVKITVTEKLILFSDFKWETLEQKKNSIVSLIEKTLKLHSLGYIHGDIKYENLGLDSDGTIYLFDFDNFSEICKKSCSLDYSSSVCHPPKNLVDASIAIGLGNQIIDLFSICEIILGNIIGLYFWAFDNRQLHEKNIQVINFKRNRIYNAIQRRIQSKFMDLCLCQFWFSLVNFFHLVFQKNKQIKNKQALTRRSKKLVGRMKMDYEITSNFSSEAMQKNKIEEIIFEDEYNVIPNIPNFIKKIKFGKNFNSCVDSLPEGIEEIEFGIKFNQPIDKLPKSLLVLRLGPDFDQSVDNLPENLEKLYFSHSCLAKFNRPMDNLPKNLKVLRTAFLFDHNIEKFPDSIQELRLNYKFAQRIHKFPKNLKDFSCSGYYIYRHQLPDYGNTLEM